MDINTNIIGRENEIALFKKCLEAILPESRGKKEYNDQPKWINFCGEKGVGKHTILSECVSICQEFYPNVKIIELNTNETNLNIWTLVKEQSETYLVVIPDIKNLFFSDIGDSSAPYVRENGNNLLGLSFNYMNLVLLTQNEKLLKGNKKIISRIFPHFNLRNKKITKLLIDVKLNYLTFEESKRFLNGFISQFSDENLKKMYEYTKGKPESLQFLLDLIQKRKVPAEIILTELINNEGKLIDDLQESIAEKNLLKIEKSSEIEHKIIATMTHNLNQKFGKLVDNFDLIKTLIEKKEQNLPTKYSLLEEVNRFYSNLLDATETFNTTYQILEKQNITKEDISLMNFFNTEIKESYKGNNFTLNIIYNIEDIKIKIDKNALKDALLNLINNAEKHGFTNKSKRYIFEFEMNIVSEKNLKRELVSYLQIICKNNGKPFPDGFSFLEFRQLAGKAGKNKGAGIGGYWVSKVIDLHNGKFRMLKVADYEEFPVQFEILLPI